MAPASPTVFKPLPAQPPPVATTGLLGWLRRNLFFSVWSTLLTLVGLYLVGWTVAQLWDWGVTHAIWDASSRRQCLDTPMLGPDGAQLLDEHGNPRLTGEHGACWAGVKTWLPAFIYGRYPVDERWRINLAFVALVLWLLPLWLPPIKTRLGIGVSAVLVYPFLAAFLFTGGEIGGWWRLMAILALALLGLSWLDVIVSTLSRRSLRAWLVRFTRLEDKHERVHRYPWFALIMSLTVVLYVLLRDWQPLEVGTHQWGGLFLTLVIAGCGMVFALPGGIVLALARRSSMPVIKVSAILFIELFRSVPLITVLFMAVTMLPLFLPEGAGLDKLVQAIIGVCLFAAAYMAEVVRGGLQAVPKAQYEAARSMGLGYWPVMGLVILPQALKLMIPNIVGNFIGLLKDTTLVSIIGLYDMLRMLGAPGQNPQWQGLHKETLLFGAVVFFVLCFAMSRYSQVLERKLRTDKPT